LTVARSGSIGHLAFSSSRSEETRKPVSNPNGPPRPFSRTKTVQPQGVSMFQTRTGPPGHLASNHMFHHINLRGVSNPNGPPRPFSRGDIVTMFVGRCPFQTQTGPPGHLARRFQQGFHTYTGGFKPERAPQAI